MQLVTSFGEIEVYMSSYIVQYARPSIRTHTDNLHAREKDILTLRSAKRRPTAFQMMLAFEHGTSARRRKPPASQPASLVASQPASQH